MGLASIDHSRPFDAKADVLVSFPEVLLSRKEKKKRNKPEAGTLWNMISLAASGYQWVA